MKSIKHYIVTFKNGIRNLIKWFPVIWFDRDYQENYIYILLLKKIDNRIDSCKKECDNKYKEIEEELSYVRNTLVRLIKDDYYGEACAFYGLKLNLNYNNVGIMKQDIEKVFTLEKKLRQQDVDTIFSDDVSSKIQGWWD